MQNTCIFLGTAGSVPSAYRDNTALLLKNARHYVLVDCPGSVTMKLLRLKVDYRAITNIILTHEHPDHIYGIPSLIHCMAMANAPQVRIYCSRPVMKIVKELLQSLKLQRRKAVPRLIFIDVFKRNVFYQSRDIAIQAVKNRHIEQSFGVKIFYRGVGKTLVYSSDTALSPQVAAAAHNCDYLIHDCSADSAYFRKRPRIRNKHTSSAQLSKIAAEASVKTLIPIHYYGSTVAFFARIQKELRSQYTGKIIIPKDLQTLEIK